MNQKSLAVIILAVLAISGVVHAQGRPEGAGNSAGQRPSMNQQRDAQSLRQQADIQRREAEARRAEAEEKSRSEAARAEHSPDKHAADEAVASADNARGGNETAAEMRTRRDERKAIQEEYRGSREPGQEGVDPDGDADGNRAQQRQQAKKPWWKFWGD